MRQAHFQTTRALAALLVLIGVGLVVSTVARGGGPLSVGVLLGLLFVALGIARLYLAGLLGPGRG